MQTMLKVAILGLAVMWLSSCAMDATTRENVYRGIYDANNQLHKHDSSTGISGEVATGDLEPVPYEQYREERKRIIKRETGEL